MPPRTDERSIDLNTLRTLAKALPRFDIKDRERQLLAFMISDGYRRTFTTYGTNTAKYLANIIGCSEWVAKAAIRDLHQRGWLGVKAEANGHTVLYLTQPFVDEAAKIVQRSMVRRHVGYKLWEFLGGDDALADRLHSQAEAADEGRYRINIKTLALALAEDRGSRPRVSSQPTRVSSQPLRLRLQPRKGA